MNNAIYMSLKLHRVMGSATTREQKRAADNYLKLFLESVKRGHGQNSRLDLFCAIAVTGFATIGIVTCLVLVARGIIF